MKSAPEWYFDEKKHGGVDYSGTEVFADYDNQRTTSRNYEE